jgi:hypothetical protein
MAEKIESRLATDKGKLKEDVLINIIKLKDKGDYI